MISRACENPGGMTKSSQTQQTHDFNPFKPNGNSHSINWNSPYQFQGLLDGIFHFYSNFDRMFFNL